MNPWQHPIFDQNIHCLVALLRLLWSHCGGVIYLMADDGQDVTEKSFKRYMERLTSKIWERFSLPVNMVRVSMVLGKCRAWAVLLLKKSNNTPYTLPEETKSIWKSATFEMDMFGHIHKKCAPDTLSHTYRKKQLRSQSSGHRRESPRYVLMSPGEEQDHHLPTSAREEAPHQLEHKTQPVYETVREGSNDTTSSQANFSSSQRLKGSENQRHRQKYVKTKGRIPVFLPPDNWENILHQTNPEASSVSVAAPVTTLGSGCNPAITRPDFSDLSSCPIPDSGESKKNFQRHITTNYNTPILLPSHYWENILHQTESVTPSAPVTLPGPSDGTRISRVDFSSCPRLDWIESRKDWQKYVETKDVKTGDIVMSCSLWKPTQPMNITPDRDSLRYLFDSEDNMDKILSAVTTEDPGFAVVGRTWRFHLSDDNGLENLPIGHICDIVTVTNTGRLSFWVVVDRLDNSSFNNQIDYLMTTGRMLKYMIVQKGESENLSNLWLYCRLLPVVTSTSMGTKMQLRLHECRVMQRHLQHLYHEGVDFDYLQQAFSKVILSKESPLKRCVSDYTSITLTVQQAEVLMHKAKVNYIQGPAGSGKSYTGAFLYKLYGKERSVYICTTVEFREYLKFNGCTGTLVLGDQDLLREIGSGTFHGKICVVIDDCHKLECTRKSMKQLFKLLKKKREMSLCLLTMTTSPSTGKDSTQYATAS